MNFQLFQTQAFKKLSVSHLRNTINFLFDSQQEFTITCQTSHLTFAPELPANIKQHFGDTVLLMLSGYTFETSNLDEDYLSFEAGFGSEQFGTTVSLPLLAIKQIFVDEYPIAINISDPEPIPKEKTKTDTEHTQNKSMEAFLNNPQNKKLLQRKKSK